MFMYTAITIVLVLVILLLASRVSRVSNALDFVRHDLKQTSQLIEVANDGMIECDLNMTVRRVNQSALAVLKTDAQTVLNKNYSSSTPKTRIEKVMKSILTPVKEQVCMVPGTVPVPKPSQATIVYEVPLEEESSLKLRVYKSIKTHPHKSEPTGYVYLLRKVAV